MRRPGIWMSECTDSHVFFVLCQIWGDYRQLILSIMKTSKKNQGGELQSRREFFKNAAKKTLPILGAIALMHLPFLSKAETPMGCNSNCKLACATDCRSGCEGKCSDHCAKSCSENCYTGCRNTCVGTCKNTCKTTCKGGNQY